MISHLILGMNKQIQEIRKRLYLLRDGASSASMRQKGVDYKLNFGVPVPKLKEIAGDYSPNMELAGLLWKENTRELKLLAILIQDPEHFEQAEEWVESLQNMELAEQLAMRLLCKLPDAGDKSARWIQSDTLYTRITGFLVYIWLFRDGYLLADEKYNSYFKALFYALSDDSVLLRNAALNSLKHFSRQSALSSQKALTECRETELLSTDLKTQLLETLTFDTSGFY